MVKALLAVGDYLVVFLGCNILHSGGFGFALSFLVVIHDGVGHNEEASVGLGEGSRVRFSHYVLISEQSSPPGLYQNEDDKRSNEGPDEASIIPKTAPRERNRTL